MLNKKLNKNIKKLLVKNKKFFKRNKRFFKKNKKVIKNICIILLIVIIIIIIVIIINTFLKRNNIVNKNNKGNINNINGKGNINSKGNNKPIIWMYWENKGNNKKPEYLNMCYESIVNKCSKSFNVILLNEKTVYNYLPDLRRDLDRKLNIPQKTDIIRFKLLYKYGGIWLDSDTIMLKNIKNVYKKLEKYDFVGFGSRKCQKCVNGYPYPSIWAMASRPNTEFIKNVINEQDKLFNSKDSNYFKRKYFILGRELVWEEIRKMKEKGWDYYHWDSSVIEKDKNGNKYTNQRLITIENFKNNNMFIPIYNTAPGFPEWFINLNKTKLLNGNMLISKLFKKALRK